MTEARHTVTMEAPIAAGWTLSIGRLTCEFDAEIVEQLPEQ
jgi:hypothetical protein